MNYLTLTIIAAIAGLALILAAVTGDKGDARQKLETRADTLSEALTLINK